MAQSYIFDLGHMLCTDPNPLPSVKGDNKEAILADTAQSCAQGLISQLLTTCPIVKNAEDSSLQIILPSPTTQLPREKPVPTEKEKTKWERFADKKGIKGKRKDGKLVYNEEKGDWVPKYGYKGKKVDDDGDWLVEIDEKKEPQRAAGGEERNGKGERREKKMKARKAK